MEKDPVTISEMDLRYKYFGGRVEMVIGDIEFISKRSNITLVDLALSLRWVVDRISQGRDAVFGFTEKEDRVTLRWIDGNVAVESSPGEKYATAEPGELIAKLAEFTGLVYSKLLEAAPGMAENPTIQRIAPS